MELKRGNTYKLNATINNVDVEDIAQIVFKFNDVEKIYKSDGTGDVELTEENVFIISLSQNDTLQLDGSVSYEIAVKFTNGEVKRSKIQNTPSINTIIERAI